MLARVASAFCISARFAEPHTEFQRHIGPDNVCRCPFAQSNVERRTLDGQLTGYRGGIDLVRPDKWDLDLLLDTFYGKCAACQVTLLSHPADVARMKNCLRKSRAIEPIRSPNCLVYISVDHVSACHDNGDVDLAVREAVFVEAHPRVEFLESARRTSLLQRCNVFELASRKVHAPVRRVRDFGGAGEQRARQQKTTCANTGPRLFHAKHADGAATRSNRNTPTMKPPCRE